ncbi:heat-inducible transcriptional repressor HrcA [Kribbia dieselivorans]|uniref:heat-inducible transcriptional repressor HrcA n=1 Tax=Kribbia dieselivorans TaxID=331526 RepID=UPI000838CF71|nr:heat-inducible transcriptional repressor HrcA [Kribbia dieselivorans]
MSDERRMDVLRAIVEDYVRTSEPVGSKALLERHKLGVSAATVRNDMAALEDEGLIMAPHTSAGRIPTDAGYRAFVDRLAEIKPMSGAERTAIREFLSGANDLDDVVDRTVRLLASLTRQVAVVQYPSLSRSLVRHIELVPMGPRRLMIVLIVNTGRVDQRVIEVDSDLTTRDAEARVARVRSIVNTAATGQALSAASTALSAAAGDVHPDDAAFMQAIVDGLADALVEDRETRVSLAGTGNLARSATDFPLTLEPVLSALEQHVVLLKLMSTAAQEDLVAVRIGHENPVAGLQSTSMVVSGYGPGDDLVGGLGVVGPTRMDYPTTMAYVRAVATYVSRIIAT